eukprot:3660919-Rhodomonas_salina.2
MQTLCARSRAACRNTRISALHYGLKGSTGTAVGEVAVTGAKGHERRDTGEESRTNVRHNGFLICRDGFLIWWRAWVQQELCRCRASHSAYMAR